MPLKKKHKLGNGNFGKFDPVSGRVLSDPYYFDPQKPSNELTRYQQISNETRNGNLYLPYDASSIIAANSKSAIEMSNDSKFVNENDENQLKYCQTHLIGRYGVTSSKPANVSDLNEWKSMTRFDQMQANSLPDNHKNMLKSLSNMGYNLKRKNFNDDELFTRYSNKSVQLEFAMLKDLSFQNPCLNGLTREIYPMDPCETLTNDIIPTLNPYVYGYVC